MVTNIGTMVFFFLRYCTQLQQKQAAALTQDPTPVSGSALLELKQHMNSVLQRAHTRRKELDILINLYEFYESVNTLTTCG